MTIQELKNKVEYNKYKITRSAYVAHTYPVLGIWFEDEDNEAKIKMDPVND